MKKSDLKSGMWVELRDGRKYLILTNADTKSYGKNIITGVRVDGFEVFDDRSYDEDMYCKMSEDYDVMKVYYNGKVDNYTYSFKDVPIYWQRKEHTELSVSEIEAKLGLKSGTLIIKKED